DVPVLTLPADLTVDCDQSTLSEYTGVAGVTAECALGQLHVNESDSVVQGACSYELIISRTWTASDGCGNVTSAVQTITVSDLTAPVFDEHPEHVIVNCAGVASSNDWVDAMPPVPAVSATDNCDVSVDVVYQETVIDDCPGTVARVWTATDDCGNSTEMIQMISFQKDCTMTRKQWANRPELWRTPLGPVETFDLGCENSEVSLEDAYEILTTRTHDELIRLKQELIIALLNISQGVVNEAASETIIDAQNFLCDDHAGETPRVREVTDDARTLRAALQNFNRGRSGTPSCPEPATGE
ncbi:MAG: hypothetical protein AAF492_21190, partial [Verrucomicrobiota bacterium]